MSERRYREINPSSEKSLQKIGEEVVFDLQAIDPREEQQNPEAIDIPIARFEESVSPSLEQDIHTEMSQSLHSAIDVAAYAVEHPEEVRRSIEFYTRTDKVTRYRFARDSFIATAFHVALGAGFSYGLDHAAEKDAAVESVSPHNSVEQLLQEDDAYREAREVEIQSLKESRERYIDSLIEQHLTPEAVEKNPNEIIAIETFLMIDAFNRIIDSAERELNAAKGLQSTKENEERVPLADRVREEYESLVKYYHNKVDALIERTKGKWTGNVLQDLPLLQHEMLESPERFFGSGGEKGVTQYYYSSADAATQLDTGIVNCQAARFISPILETAYRDAGVPLDDLQNLYAREWTDHIANAYENPYGEKTLVNFNSKRYLAVSAEHGDPLFDAEGITKPNAAFLMTYIHEHGPTPEQGAAIAWMDADVTSEALVNGEETKMSPWIEYDGFVRHPAPKKEPASHLFENIASFGDGGGGSRSAAEVEVGLRQALVIPENGEWNLLYAGLLKNTTRDMIQFAHDADDREHPPVTLSADFWQIPKWYSDIVRERLSDPIQGYVGYLDLRSKLDILQILPFLKDSQLQSEVVQGMRERNTSDYSGDYSILEDTVHSFEESEQVIVLFERLFEANNGAVVEGALQYMDNWKNDYQTAERMLGMVVPMIAHGRLTIPESTKVRIEKIAEEYPTRMSAAALYYGWKEGNISSDRLQEFADDALAESNGGNDGEDKMTFKGLMVLHIAKEQQDAAVLKDYLSRFYANGVNLGTATTDRYGFVADELRDAPQAEQVRIDVIRDMLREYREVFIAQGYITPGSSIPYNLDGFEQQQSEAFIRMANNFLPLLYTLSPEQYDALVQSALPELAEVFGVDVSKGTPSKEYIMLHMIRSFPDWRNPEWDKRVIAMFNAETSPSERLNMLSALSHIIPQELVTPEDRMMLEMELGWRKDAFVAKGLDRSTYGQWGFFRPPSSYSPSTIEREPYIQFQWMQFAPVLLYGDTEKVLRDMQPYELEAVRRILTLAQEPYPRAERFRVLAIMHDIAKERSIEK